MFPAKEDQMYFVADLRACLLGRFNEEMTAFHLRMNASPKDAAREALAAVTAFIRAAASVERTDPNCPVWDHAVMTAVRYCGEFTSFYMGGSHPVPHGWPWADIQQITCDLADATEFMEVSEPFSRAMPTRTPIDCDGNAYEVTPLQLEALEKLERLKPIRFYHFGVKCDLRRGGRGPCLHELRLPYSLVSAAYAKLDDRTRAVFLAVLWVHEVIERRYALRMATRALDKLNIPSEFSDLEMLQLRGWRLD